MYFIFDTETSGLPKGRYASYKSLDAYETCRIVSIAWIVLPEGIDPSDSEEIDMTIKKNRFTTLIRPDDFVIGQASINIHGITNERAAREGVPFDSIVPMLEQALNNAHTLVAHNLRFDFGVLLSELHRRGHRSAIDKIFKMERICTMRLGHAVCNQGGHWPKLTHLYATLTGKELVGAHDALADTTACAECFIKLRALSPT